MNIPYEPKNVTVHPATIARRKKRELSGTGSYVWADDRSLLGRFMSKLAYAGDCIVWTASTNENGYGTMSIDGKTFKAHRIAYELQYGPIPEGLVIDHLCRNRICVNPAHLQPVTHKTNTYRGDGRKVWEARAAKTHCNHGHELTPENVQPIGPGGRGRGCKQCHYYTNKGLRLMRRFGYAIVDL